jgi:molecular chaperone GrpE
MYSQNATERTEQVQTEVPVDEVDAAELLERKAERIKELEDQIRQAKDSWKLALAETDNLTKRMHKEVAKGREAGTDKMAQTIFSVGDILDLCLRNKPDLEAEEFANNLQLKGAFDGLAAAKTSLTAALQNTANITEIAPQPGDNFDPMLHNACFEVEEPTIEPGQIAVVIKAGYVKGDTLLRPADVGIVKHVPAKGKVYMDEEDDDEWPEQTKKD